MPSLISLRYQQGRNRQPIWTGNCSRPHPRVYPSAASSARPKMLRRAAKAAIRQCSSTTKPVSRISAAFDCLMEVDWVDTEDHLDVAVASAESAIHAYRASHDPSNPDDAALQQVERLHVAKEASRVSDALADYVEVLVRRHEDMLGPLGDNIELPENGADETVQLLEQYVALVNSIADREIRQKLQMELGRKMVVLRQVLSMQGFSARIAPIAGDRIVTRTTLPERKGT